MSGKITLKPQHGPESNCAVSSRSRTGLHCRPAGLPAGEVGEAREARAAACSGWLDDPEAAGPSRGQAGAAGEWVRVKERQYHERK